MAAYLEQNLACWTGQTLSDIELIYIDDGSTDDSLRILQDWARKDSRIHLCAFSENKGTWAARNAGIEKAQGRCILFADADDTVLPETCEELSLAMDDSQTDILQYGVEILNPHGLPQQDIAGVEQWVTPYDGLLYGREVFTSCFRDGRYCWNLAGKVFRAELCKKVLSDIAAAGIQTASLRAAEDALLCFMLSCRAQSYKGLPQKKYYQYYYGRGGSGQKHCTLQHFENLCSHALVASYMQDFLERQNSLKTYEDVVHRTRKALLEINVRAWKDLTMHDKAKGFALLLSCWNTAEVLARLTRLQLSALVPDRIKPFVKGLLHRILH